MPITRLALLCVGVTAILGCSNDSTIPVDTAGAPVVVAITGIKANGADLAVTYTVQNKDTADVTYQGCAAEAEVFRDGAWVGVTPLLPCYFVQFDLVPGHTATGSVTAHGVDASDQLRVSFHWSYLSKSDQMVARSDPRLISN